MDEDRDREVTEDTVPRESEDELSDEELRDVAGGSISLNFTQVITTTKPQ